MEIKGNYAYFDVHRSEKFEQKASTIIIVIATILFSLTVTFGAIFIATSKESKPISNEIKEIEASIHDDYTKAATLDERTSIEIYENEIVVEVNTKNFMLKEFYDKDGNFTKSVIEGKLSVLEAIIVIAVSFVILSLPVLIAHKSIKKKIVKLENEDYDEMKICRALCVAKDNLYWKKINGSKEEIDIAQRNLDELKKKYNISEDVTEFKARSFYSK